MLGFIKLQRDILNSTLWGKHRKSHFEAWVFILMGANWQDGKVKLGYEIIDIKRGQFFTSQDQLAKEFKWDRNAVRKFLYMMQKNNTIELVTTNKYTMITICNYASYQDILPARGQQEGSKEAAEGQQEGITKKNKKKEENTLGEKTINIEFEEFWSLYDKKVGDKDKIKKKWEALADQDRILTMQHIPKYKTAQPEKNFRKDPATYLNNKSWNDEVIYKNGHSITPPPTGKPRFKDLTNS